MGRKYFNGVKTLMLFGAMWALLAVLAYVISDRAHVWMFIVAGIVISIVTVWNSDKIALRTMNARPVTEVEQPAMFRIVSELSREANQPMPRLYVSPTAAPNAFATGRNPRNAAVCCTAGVLDLLTERELRGVLGHELMHVYNRDILIGSMAAAFAGIVTIAAQWLYYAGFLFGGRRDSNPLVLIGMLILAPIAATLIRLAVSRTREYDADEDGAKLTGDPLALASALAKIHEGATARPLAQKGAIENVSHLMIANPFKGAGLARLYQSHPPMENRIERLEAMANQRGFIA